MRFIARWVLLGFVLPAVGCQRASPNAVGNVDAGQNVAPSASSPVAPSAKLHPALGGKPVSHWNELAIKGSEVGPLPAEVFESWLSAELAGFPFRVRSELDVW